MGKKMGIGSTPAVLSLLAILVFAGIIVSATQSLAENGARLATPSPQPEAGYWTHEKMRSAKPAMPGVPGRPHGGSTPSGRSGPAGGSPGHAPTAPPEPSERPQ
jgi:hypothetical protein